MRNALVIYVGIHVATLLQEFVPGKEGWIIGLAYFLHLSQWPCLYLWQEGTINVDTNHDVIYQCSLALKYHVSLNDIIESVDSICRDSADMQYILIQTNFSKSPKQLN